MTFVKVGDWIKFRHSGNLVIAQVEYILARQYFYEKGDRIITQVGECYDDDVLELRRPSSDTTYHQLRTTDE